RAEFGWHAFLERSFNSSRPWDEVCREILLARPQRDDDRGATWFLFERQEKYQEIAEAVSPAIFGVQIQCAQCHDHPLAEEIEQRHYWGLVSFFNRGKAEMRSGKPQVIESAIGGFHKYASLTGESLDAELVFLGRPRAAMRSWSFSAGGAPVRPAQRTSGRWRMLPTCITMQEACACRSSRGARSSSTRCCAIIRSSPARW